MIKIKKRKDLLLLEYESEYNQTWIETSLEHDGHATIRKTFTFLRKDIYTSANGVHAFILGERVDSFYRIKARVFNIDHDVYLSTNMKIEGSTFVAIKDISVFSKIDDLISEPIAITEIDEPFVLLNGKQINVIPLKEFQLLLKKFPGTTEVKHYANARISMILKQYLGSMTDAQKQLSNYLDKKKPLSVNVERQLSHRIHEYEVNKFRYIRDRIHEELTKESLYSEDEWQDILLEFILLIFPKYILALSKIKINDFYSKSGKITSRYIDIGLIDANGNLDILELKKPFSNCIISNTRYRDNFVPKKELSGSIMQAEKYIFHLNKWGIEGERILTKRYSTKLPSEFQIKITNSKALVILGRSNELVKEQLLDLELIKRKYSNVLDILTYDDLLKRLDNIIEQLESKMASSQPS